MAAGAVERHHQVGGERLPKGMLANQALELPTSVGASPRRRSASIRSSSLEP